VLIYRFTPHHISTQDYPPITDSIEQTSCADFGITDKLPYKSVGEEMYPHMDYCM